MDKQQTIHYIEDEIAKLDKIIAELNVIYTDVPYNSYASRRLFTSINDLEHHKRTLDSLVRTLIEDVKVQNLMNNSLKR